MVINGYWNDDHQMVKLDLSAQQQVDESAGPQWHTDENQNRLGSHRLVSRWFDPRLIIGAHLKWLIQRLLRFYQVPFS